MSKEAGFTMKLEPARRSIGSASIDQFGFIWTIKNPQAFIHADFLDFFGRC